MRMRFALVVLGAAVIAAGTAAAAPTANPKLVGLVGPKDAYTISLKDSKGKKVTALKAGTYTFVITDGSSLHSFVVEGPGVARDITSVPFKGTKTVTVKLRKGKYKYYCRAHESSMFGFFTVK